jgi:hypothetical protein
MTIDKFRKQGSVLDVAYSVGPEAFSVSTMDSPEKDLILAANDVAECALAAAGVDLKTKYRFFSASWAHGDNPGSRVVLEIPTMEGDRARLALPLISARPITKGGEVVDCPRNTYNRAMDALVAEITAFVVGKRQQMALPFEAPAP